MAARSRRAPALPPSRRRVLATTDGRPAEQEQARRSPEEQVRTDGVGREQDPPPVSLDEVGAHVGVARPGGDLLGDDAPHLAGERGRRVGDREALADRAAQLRLEAARPLVEARRPETEGRQECRGDDEKDRPHEQRVGRSAERGPRPRRHRSASSIWRSRDAASSGPICLARIVPSAAMKYVSGIP